MSIADKVLQLKNDFDEVKEVAFIEGNSLGIEEGRNIGYADGYREGYDKCESDFWDKLQRNGKLANYAYAFAGVWLPSMFYPKYDIKPTRCESMFVTFDNNYSMNEPILDLVERLNECGVVLDTSKATNINLMFSYAKISHIGVIDTTSATALSQTFSNGRAIITIDKLILKADGSQTFSSAFTNCVGLENIVIEGVIGRDIDFKSSPLTIESAKSVINALADYSGTSSANKYTVQFSEDTINAIHTEGATAPNGDNWIEYAIDKGWNC